MGTYPQGTCDDVIVKSCFAWAGFLSCSEGVTDWLSGDRNTGRSFCRHVLAEP
jgi:hypothetical protein